MLIKVFGIWLMTTNISHLSATAFDANDCVIKMVPTYNSSFQSGKSCDETAAEINRLIKEVK